MCLKSCLIDFDWILFVRKLLEMTLAVDVFFAVSEVDLFEPLQRQRNHVATCAMVKNLAELTTVGDGHQSINH